MAKATTTKATTRTATATGNALDWYRDTLKGWPTKFAGKAPTAQQFETAHALGAKPGTKTAIAIAMYLRPEGATQSQVTVVNNGPYLNKMRALIAAKQAVRLPVSPVDGHTVYKLALPSKTAVKAASKAAGKRKAAPKAKANAAPEAAQQAPEAANA